MEVQEQEHSPPRLIISEMVLEDFKSYAGKQRVGPFHKSFSSVVGPNGSGKSNVIDAMLFVFGKRAKQLRLNKVSELIHNSTHHRNLESARVSVHFEEIIDLADDGFQTVPGSAFAVSRTAHRNNSSDYHVDGRRSNFTEVTALLRGKGVDLDNNRFLILQGEVEQISMMKPKSQGGHDAGLMEYLEDIIGTDKYVERIEQQAKELEGLNDARQGQVSRVKLAERECEALEGDRQQALAYLDRQRQVLQAQDRIYQKYSWLAQGNLSKSETSVAELEARLKHEHAKCQTYSDDLKQSEARFKEMSAEHARVAAELEASHEEFRSFERQDIKHREELKHMKAKVKKLQEKLGKDEARLQGLSSKNGQTGGDELALAACVQKQTDQLHQEEQALEALLEGTHEEVEQHTKALQGVRLQLAPWEQRMGEARSRLDVAVAEQQMLQRSHAEAVQRLQAAQQGVQEAQQAAAEQDALAERMVGEEQQHRQEAAAAHAELAAAQEQLQQRTAALHEVRGCVEQQRAEQAAHSSQGAVIKALMAAKSSGQLSGLHGRLGDLGAIDARYDVAVSTACPALDYVVVETTAAAQAAVELLRRQGLGVATFLILEKQQRLARAMQAAATPPEGVPRLFDLVRVRDERLRPAFFFALRDTLVADDLEQASRIAYGSDRRWARVVTLKGEMINEAGTLSGGGGKPRGGRMWLGSAAPRALDTADAAQELVAAEGKLESHLQAVGQAREAVSSHTAALQQAEAAVARLAAAIPKARLEAAAQRDRAQDLRQQLGRLQAAAKVSQEDTRRLAALAHAIKSGQAELAGLQASAQQLQDQASGLQARIDNAGGDAVREQRALVARLQKDIAAAEAEATRRRVQAAASTKQAAKLEKDLAKGRADLQAAKAGTEGKQQAFKDLEEAALRVMEASQGIEALLREKDGQLAGLRGEYEQKQKEVTIIRTVEVELEAKLRDVRDLQREEAVKLRKWRAALGGIAKQLQELRGQAGEQPPAEEAVLTEEQLAQVNAQELEYRVTMLEEEIGRMSPDLGAIAAHAAKEAEHAQRLHDLEAATRQRDEVRRAHEELRRRRLDEFMAGFNCISLRLKEMYQMITLGGDAELELVDSLDPFSEGIVFSVRPPKKSWKNIANLSGGEKTLSSLSLVFALHHYKPTPLYVMDEIDAALDFKNVSIVAHYIKERTRDAQFIIISLRNNMFELADRLVGIYKTDNATKSVAINPGAYADAAPPAKALGHAHQTLAIAAS